MKPLQTWGILFFVFSLTGYSMQYIKTGHENIIALSGTVVGMILATIGDR